MLLQWVYQLFDIVLFRVLLIFLETPFYVVKLGIKINIPIFKSVAGVKRELIWLLMFRLCNNFFVIFWYTSLRFISI